MKSTTAHPPRRLFLLPVCAFALLTAGVVRAEGATTRAPTPTPTAESVEGKGSLDKDLIRQTISSRKDELKGCYDAELKSKPSLKGQMTVRFVIGVDGTVQTSEVRSSTLASPAVEGCVAKVVRSLAFPRPKGGTVVVSYPLVFSPDDARHAEPSAPPSVEATGQGTLDKDAIRQAMLAHKGHVKACYDAQLKGNPSLKGRLMVRFVIGTDGRVQKSEVSSSTLSAPAVEGCVAKAVGAIVFPKPTGGSVVVNYPLVFSPDDEPAREGATPAAKTAPQPVAK